MPILTRRRQLAAKIEVTEGSAETLAAGDVGALIINPSYKPEITLLPREVVFDSLSKFRDIPGTQAGRITFRSEMKGSGTAGTAPAIGKFLKACGFGETVVAVTSVTYAPISAAIPTLTIALNSGDDAASGVRRLLKGCRGNVKFMGKVGEPMFAEFEFLGVYVPPTDLAPIGAVTYELTTEPQPILSATFSIGGYAAKIENLTVDMTNTLALRTDISQASGFFSCLVTDRRPKGGFDPEDTLVATQDWWGKLKAGTEGAMSMVIGATGGNIITITAPKVQYANVQEAERNRLMTLGVELNFNKSVSAGNDEVSIAFT